MRPRAGGSTGDGDRVRIFLSFSGTDSAAAGTVTAALASAGHDVWRFDENPREGIDFRREMLGKVVSCDLVIFLASRASVGSAFCADELACAAEHGRRVVVVRVDDIRGADLPPTVRTITRIDLDGTPEFATALNVAVMTDIDLVRAIADLDERATTWAKNGRPSRLLAHRRELPAFERVISRADDVRVPVPGLRPTQDARDFALRSRTRQRARTGIVSVAGLAVAVAVAVTIVLVVTTSANAVDQRDRAQVAAELVDRASTARATDPLRALRLGIAADRIHPDSRTRAGLVATMTSTRYRGALPGASPTFAAGRPLVATAGRAGARLWDVTDPARARPVAVAPTADGTEPTAIGFSPDGSRLAVGGADGAVVLYDADAVVRDPAMPPRPLLTTDPREQEPDSLMSATGDVAFAPGGDLLVVSTGDPAPQVWDVRAGRRVASLRDGPTGVSVTAFSPDGRTVATGDADGAVRLWDVRGPRRPVRVGPAGAPDGSAISGMAFSGTLLVVGSFAGPSRLWDVSATPTTVGELPDPGGGASAVAASRTTPVVAISSLNGATTTLWNIADPRLPVRLGDPPPSGTEPVRSAEFDVRGALLATGGGNTSTVWTTAEPSEPHAVGRPLTSGDDALSFAALAPDGRTAAISAPGRSAQLFDVTDRAAPRPLGDPFTPGDTTVFDAAFAPGKGILATATDSGVTLWNVSVPGAPERISERPVTGLVAETVSVQFSPDGRTLAAVVSDGTVRSWDVGNPALPGAPGAPITGDIASVAFSPDGAVLATGSYDGSVTLHDLAEPGTPRPLTPPLGGQPGSRGAVASLAFSPRGVLAAGRDDGTVVLWDVRVPARTAPIGQPIDAASGGEASAVAFTPDGELLVTSSDIGTVTVRDVTEPAAPVILGRPLDVHDSAAESLAVTPGGDALATGSYDGKVVLVDLTRLVDLRDRAAEVACDLAGGGFDAQDWARFVPRRAFEVTCPP